MPKLRMDRLLTLALFNPLRCALTGTGGWRMPILMYHGISDSSEDQVSPYYRTATGPKIFAAQMELLRSEGWQVVGIRRGLELMRSAGPQSGKVIVITFDDGYRDFLLHAFPVLMRHGFSATMFLSTAFIGEQRLQFKERECLTWAEVRELHQAGIEFGSHTVTHPVFYEMEFPQIRAELEVSKAVLEEKLGQRVPSFAYPFAFPSADRAFVERFVELLKTTGYESNVTTRIGRARIGDDPFTLKRLHVNSVDDRALFLAKLRGSYDWMAWSQDWVKKVKSLVSPPRGAAEPRPCRAP